MVDESEEKVARAGGKSLPRAYPSPSQASQMDKLVSVPSTFPSNLKDSIDLIEVGATLRPWALLKGPGHFS